MTLTRLALPAFVLIWTLMTGMLIYGWLNPDGALSSYWLKSWFQLMLGLIILAGGLIILVLRHHRRTLNVLADAMPDMVEHGVGYQIRSASQYGEEVVLFNRLSRRLAATLAQLEGERQLLSETLDNVNGVVLVIDGQGKIELVTPYAMHAFGWQQEQLINHPISLLLPHYADITADREAGACASGTETRSIARCEDGDIRQVRVQFQPRSQAAGHVLLLYDVSAELKAEGEGELLKAALDNGDQRLLLFDDTDQLLWASSAASAMLTDGKETLPLGQNYNNIMTRAVVMGVFPDAIANPESWLHEAQHCHTTAESIRVLRLQDGHQVREHSFSIDQGGSVSSFPDISSHASAEPVSPAEKTRYIDSSRLLAAINSRLRTPLNNTISLLEQLQHEGNTAKRDHYITAALETTGKQAELLNSLCDLAQLENQTLQLHDQPCQLPTLIQGIVEQIQPLADQKSLLLCVASNTALPGWVLLDSTRVSQVLLNLLNNAVQCTDQGEVRLQTDVNGDCLRFEVADTGSGISATQQQQLFSPFVMSSDNNPDGSGMGLAISQRLLERMGAELQFSTTTGSGTRFWFELARVAVEEPEHSEPQENTEPPILMDSTLQPITHPQVDTDR